MISSIIFWYLLLMTIWIIFTFPAITNVAGFKKKMLFETKTVCSHFFFLCGASQFVGSWLLPQGLNPCPLQWKCKILTIGPPGYSPLVPFKGRGELYFISKGKQTSLLSPAPKATGVRPCTKATEVEPRSKVTSKADWAPLGPCQKPSDSY